MMASAGAVLSEIMWLRNSMITDGSHPPHVDPDPAQTPSSTAPQPTTQQPWVFPRDVSIESVTACLRGLASISPPPRSLLGRPAFVFETIAGPDSITHRLRVPGGLAEATLGQLRATIPGVRVRPVETAAVPAVSVVRELRLAPGDGEIRTDQAAGFATGLLAAMQPLAAHDYEAIIVQWTVYPVHRPVARPTQQPTGSATAKPTKSLGRWAWQQLTTPEPAGTRISEDKINEQWFGVVGRVGAVSTARGRSRHVVDRVVGQLRQLDRNRARFRTRPLSADHGRRVLAIGQTPLIAAPIHANAREVAVLVGWPLGLSGATGSGKSTLLLNLIKQDIEAGNGLILIDPNGDLARDTINCITPERVGDLIYLNPADDLVLPLNPLDCAPDDVELVADQLLKIIRDRADSWGVQLDETLRAALTLLAASPGMTLVELSTVLVDASLRARLVSGLDPVLAPTVGEFFSRYESWPPGQQAQNASAVINKITPWLGRRQIRAMLGQSDPTWTVRQVIDEGKLLVVSLPSGVIGPEAADLIGGTVVSQCWNAVQGRIARDRANRRPVSMIIDELPRFLRGGSDLADILARARGHGLGLVGAIQHIAQVPPNLRAALLSEARNKVVFQPAADDGALFARHLPGVTADDLLALEPRTAVASLVVGGQVMAPVTIATYPPPQPSGQGDAARHASRLRYGRDRAEVETQIQERRRGPGPGPRRTRRLP